MDVGHRPRLAGRMNNPAHFDRSIPVLYDSSKKVRRSKDNY